MATDAKGSRLALAIAVAAVTAVAAACGTATSTTHGPRPHMTAVIHDRANGTTVRVQVGDHVELIMSSGYWQVHGSSSDVVLAQDGGTKSLPRPKNCPPIPGLGCIPFEIMFTARAKGTAVITASRQTCGEALKCQPPQRHFRVTIVVG
jgi:hypothetical protein